MALFNIIRDFYVVYIFGGMASNRQNYSFFLGRGSLDGTSLDTIYSNGLTFGITNSNYVSVTFGDWFSTTATIITLIVILCCIAYFIRWIFKVCSNAILLR